ncbi:MAG: anti-phage defense ZorAB system ZorA, partial [Oceanospirillaceae bacterium]|nr:anti-phage defense ZorAB system ZorA [Oceanospirillaceae bacterium]
MFYLVIFSVLLILGLLFYSIFKLKVYKKKSKILLNKLNKHLSKLKLETINYEHHIVSDEIKNNSNVDIINLWREFEESLVTHNDRIENTLDAEHFFNENTIASKVFNNDFLKGVPNLMVGLGVAFTFIGLVIGLSGLNIASDDIESLKSGIESIIGGAKVSFWSSIAGIISSIVFTSYHSISKNKLRSGINELQKFIDYKYPRTNPEKSLAEMREYSKETEMHLGALSETLGDKLQEAVRGVGAEISSSVESSLTNAIGPYMDKIANKAMNSSESAFEQLIEEFLDKIGEAGREQQKLIQETNKTLNDSLIDFNN